MGTLSPCATNLDETGQYSTRRETCDRRDCLRRNGAAALSSSGATSNLPPRRQWSGPGGGGGVGFAATDRVEERAGFVSRSAAIVDAVQSTLK